MRLGLALKIDFVAVVHGVPPIGSIDTLPLETNQLGGKVGHRVRPTLSKTRVDRNVLPFNPPELAQSLPERLYEMWVRGWRRVRKITDPVDPARLLRLNRQRRGEEAEDQHAERGEERPALQDEIGPPAAPAGTPPLRSKDDLRYREAAHFGRLASSATRATPTRSFDLFPDRGG